MDQKTRMAKVDIFLNFETFHFCRSSKENRLEEKEVPSTMLEVDVTEAESVLPPDILYMLKSIK